MSAPTAAQTPRYDQTGNGPALLFLHSDPARQQTLLADCATLATSHFKVVVAVVSPAEDGARQVVTLLKHLGIGRAVVMALGDAGQTLIELLEQHPERIAAASFVADRALVEELRQRTAHPRIQALLRSGRHASLARALASARRPASAYGAVQAWAARIVAQCRSGISSCSALLARLDLPGLIPCDDGDGDDERTVEAH